MEQLPEPILAFIFDLVPFRDRIVNVSLVNHKLKNVARISLKNVTSLTLNSAQSSPLNLKHFMTKSRLLRHQSLSSNIFILNNDLCPSELVDFLLQFCPKIKSLIANVCIREEDALKLADKLNFLSFKSIKYSNGTQTPLTLPLMMHFTNLTDFFEGQRDAFCRVELLKLGLPLDSLELPCSSSCATCLTFLFDQNDFGLLAPIKMPEEANEVNQVNKLSKQIKHLVIRPYFPWKPVCINRKLPNLVSFVDNSYPLNGPHYSELLNCCNLREINITVQFECHQDALNLIYFLTRVSKLNTLIIHKWNCHRQNVNLPLEKAFLPLGQMKQLKRFTFVLNVFGDIFKCKLVKLNLSVESNIQFNLQFDPFEDENVNLSRGVAFPLTDFTEADGLTKLHLTSHWPIESHVILLNKFISMVHLRNLTFSIPGVHLILKRTSSLCQM